MKCIVIDDEPLARKGMEAYIKKVSFMELKGSFSSAGLASTYLEQHEADVMFLDINMPQLSGLDFARSLPNGPLIIFTTAYPQYALDSYDLDTIDYLVKPIGFERFLKAVNKSQHYLKLINSEEKNNEVENIKDDFIFVRADRMFYKLSFKEICFIEALKDYVIIHTEDRKLMTAMNIKTISLRLPDYLFVRVSKSYLVNLTHIVSLDKNFVYIRDATIPIGAAYRETFFQNEIIKKWLNK
jgi:DNA-binding LytR/AlgR family response regulator